MPPPDYTLLLKLYQKNKEGPVLDVDEDTLLAYYPFILNDSDGNFIFKQYSIKLFPPPIALRPKEITPL